MNRRDDDFGYLLPLDYGENVIVLVADDRAGNLSSKLVRVERSDRFRAAITSPAFGTFAEGQSNVVTGFVSAKIDVGQPTETNVVSVTINGGPVTLHGQQMDEDGNVPFTRDEPLSPDAQPIGGVITWADGRTTEMPPSYQEDYEVVARRSETRRVVDNDEAGGAWLWGEGGDCWPQWVLGSVAEVIRTNEYSQPDPAGWITVVTAGWKYRESAYGCVFDPETDEGAWDGWTNGCPSMWGWPQASCSETNLVPKRSLTFGHHRPYTYALYLNGSEWLWPWTETTDASLRFRAPLHYRTNQLVVFTFEGMEYGRPAGAPQDLGLVKFIFNGKTNEAVAVSNEVQSVSYLITVDGGKEYTLTPNSFLWPTTSTNWVEQYVDPYNPFYDYTAWHTNTYHTLTFTGFHNRLPDAGPDVTALVAKVLADVQAAWNGWSDEQKCIACKSLRNLVFVVNPSTNGLARYLAGNAWDILPLVNIGIGNYDYIHPIKQGVPPDDPIYGRTVVYRGRCYLGGAVNYVLWGKMNSLCYQQLGKSIYQAVEKSAFPPMPGSTVIPPTVLAAADQPGDTSVPGFVPCELLLVTISSCFADFIRLG